MLRTEGHKFISNSSLLSRVTLVKLRTFFLPLILFKGLHFFLKSHTDFLLRGICIGNRTKLLVQLVICGRG